MSTSRPWLRKLSPAEVPVTPRSVALFRLSEACNNRCPMCSNSGRTQGHFTSTDELLARVERLASWGMRRVVLTGGEPTIHPGFWAVVTALGRHQIAWDINSHGRAFADAAFATRAADEGLERAIISLHSHVPAVASVISGVGQEAWLETVAGVRNLLDSQQVSVMLNHVLTRPNFADVSAYVRWCVERFGTGCTLKLAFPTTVGRGGGWDGLHLRYSEVRAPLGEALATAAELDVQLVFESVPSCVVSAPGERNVSRSGFGETHYLEDLEGQRLIPVRQIEAALALYPASCRGCAALRRCSGVEASYLERWGVAELRALPG